jgi:hypothetical protein
VIDRAYVISDAAGGGVSIPGAAVREASTWVLMISGFSLVGFLMRRRVSGVGSSANWRHYQRPGRDEHHCDSINASGAVTRNFITGPTGGNRPAHRSPMTASRNIAAH